MNVYDAIVKLKGHLASSHQVGGITKLVPVQLTTVDAAYADGESIDGCKKVDGAVRESVYVRSGIIQSIKAQFESGVAATNLEIYFFREEVTATDSVAFAPSAAEQKQMVPYAKADGTGSGPILLEAANKETLNSIDTVSLNGLGIPFQANVDENKQGSLYMVVVATAALDFSAGDNLHITVGILQD